MESESHILAWIKDSCQALTTEQLATEIEEQDSPANPSSTSSSKLASPLFITPPSSEDPSRLKRKYHSMPEPERASSPAKRRRVPTEASEVGSRNLFQLDASTVLSASSQGSRSSPKRASSSPTRDHAIDLRTATPAIITDSLTGTSPPVLVRQLRNALAVGFGRSFIPIGLKETILANPTRFDDIDDDAYDERDDSPEQHLATLLDDVHDIFTSARDCEQNHRDENAWCIEVVQPLLRLAIRLHGTGEWILQSVQSQRIQASYLSRTASNVVVERKTDFALTYSHRHGETSQLYEKLAHRGLRDRLGHTTDSFTKRTALFSGIEVKPGDGGHAQAQLQLSVWLAASLRNKSRLVDTAMRISGTSESSRRADDKDGLLEVLPEPGLTIVGHDHQVYYSYLEDGGDVRLLGPDDRLNASTRSIRGVFLLLDLYKRLLTYGAAGGSYKDWLFDGVLGRLIGDSALHDQRDTTG